MLASETISAAQARKKAGFWYAIHLADVRLLDEITVEADEVELELKRLESIVAGELALAGMEVNLDVIADVAEANAEHAGDLAAAYIQHNNLVMGQNFQTEVIITDIGNAEWHCQEHLAAYQTAAVEDAELAGLTITWAANPAD
jgi:hypothetical protein